ncbi:MAG TPA: hypothetical protein VEL05_01635 [Candidatus Acidoferrum sp.]|nr:hypothetical protein [Candidatus Acidoferrum sp.]
MPHEDGEEGDAPGGRPLITLLYVRPFREGLTELDRRVGAIAERYAQWVELVVVRPEDLVASPDLERVAASGSPALLLLRQGEVVGEAMGALLPARELDQVVRRAVEWPAPM